MSILTRISNALTSFTRPAGTSESSGPKTAALWSDTAVNELIELLTRIPETDELLTQAGITRASLKKLETDDEIFQGLRTRREAVVATPWRFEGGDEVTNALLEEELKPLMEQIVSGAWKAVPFGYSVLEAVYRRREDGKIGLANVVGKPIEWFDPRPDGSLRYFAADGLSADGEVCDQTYTFFLTRVDHSYQQPKGEALLSRLYWPWFFRFNGWRFWGQFLERFGQPLLVGKSSKPEAMAKALLNAHQDAVIAIGPQDDVAAVSPVTSGEAFEKLEQAVVRRFQKVILGQTLTSDTGKNGGGSYALGQVHAEVKESLRKADIRLVRGTVQRIVNALCALNNVVKDVPEIVFADDAGLEVARADRDNKLNAIGVRFTKEYFLDRYDLREDDFEIVQVSSQPFGGTPGDPQTSGRSTGDSSASGEDAGGTVPTDENGDPTNPQAELARRLDVGPMAFARKRKSDPKRFVPAQQKIEEMADDALGVCPQVISTALVREAVLAARDPQDLEDRLAVLIGSNNPQFARTLEQAIFAADVIGYLNAEGKI
jgi:phage gp29-like protein